MANGKSNLYVMCTVHINYRITYCITKMIDIDDMIVDMKKLYDTCQMIRSIYLIFTLTNCV